MIIVLLNQTLSRQQLGKQKIKQDNNLVFVNSRRHIKDDIFFDKLQPSIQEFTELAWFSYAKYATEYGILNLPVAD